MKPVTAIVVGAGGRGFAYANLAKTDALKDLVKVVGVAEPRAYYRKKMIKEHDIQPDKVFRTWQQLAKQPKLADAVFICTMDAMHEKGMLALAKLGYHILLEKPMAPNAKACVNIYKAAKEAQKNGKHFAVCHVLRYTNYSRIVKKMITDGLIGDIVTIDHHEPVGFLHQAHSFIRGNWRNEKESSCMLLQKSCHDIDWLRFIIHRPCLKVSSFGGLSYFKKENQPAGAADRCMDCQLSDECPYSAKRFYFGALEDPARHGWPLDVVDPTFKAKNLEKALREGPYGRCVFACDNDVVDHQVVNMEYEGGITATFSMYAFNNGGGRKTRIGGTKGYLETNDSSIIRHFDYLTKEWKEIYTEAADQSMAGGHGGGDGGVLGAFIHAIVENDPSLIITGPEETLESHLTVFAAEKARHTGKVVDIQKFTEKLLARK